MKKLITILLIALTLAMAALCFVGCAPEEKPEEQPKLLMTFYYLESIGYKVKLYRYKDGGKYIMEDSNIEERTGNFLKDQSDQYLPDSVMQRGEELKEIFKDCIMRIYETKIEFESEDGTVIRSYKISGEALTIRNYSFSSRSIQLEDSEKSFNKALYYGSSSVGIIHIFFDTKSYTATETQPVIEEEFFLDFKYQSPLYIPENSPFS